MAYELARMLLRKSVGTMARDRSSCSKCRRTPLPGEVVHQIESGELLCALCLGSLPESMRNPVHSERVPASDRHLPVVPRAA
jgi:hypothetical protein